MPRTMCSTQNSQVFCDEAHSCHFLESNTDRILMEGNRRHASRPHPELLCKKKYRGCVFNLFLKIYILFIIICIKYLTGNISSKIRWAKHNLFILWYFLKNIGRNLFSKSLKEHAKNINILFVINAKENVIHKN